MPQPNFFNAATGQWVHSAAVIDPSGGATVDANARTAMVSILAALRAYGAIAGATQLPASHTFSGPTSQIVLASAIATVTGGATIDVEARVAINALLVVMRNAGIIAGGSDPSTLAMTYDEDTGSVAPGAAIATVAGGATVDTECRAAINAALVAARSRGLIAQD